VAEHRTRDLAAELKGHDVSAVQAVGSSETSNGELLRCYIARSWRRAEHDPATDVRYFNIRKGYRSMKRSLAVLILFGAHAATSGRFGLSHVAERTPCGPDRLSR